MPAIFDTSKCSISSIAAIPADAFAYVDDCEIPFIPPPIMDCPVLDIDLPQIGPVGPAGVAGLPGLDGPCPRVNLNVTGSKIEYSKKATNPRFIVNLDKSSSSSICEYDNDFQISLSLPCPDFDFEASASSLPAAEIPTASVKKRDKYPSEDKCGSVLTFKFGVPKPSIWLSGYGPPSNSIGRDNDFYLNRGETYLGSGVYGNVGRGDVYKKKNGNWGPRDTNIKGDDGSDGADGSNGEPCTPDCPRVTGVTCTGGLLIVGYATKCDAVP